MIVDDKGNVFEDRRKNKDDIRKNIADARGGEKVVERRKNPSQEKNKKRK